MEIWHMFVSQLEAVTTLLAAALGSKALAVVAVSATLRLTLLPWSVRAARAGWERAEKMHALKPTLDRLKEKFQKNPALLMEKTMDLMRREKVQLFDIKTMFAPLLQAPFLMGFYAVLKDYFKSEDRFLWITEMGKPDFWLGTIAITLFGLSMALTPSMSDSGRMLMVLLPTLVTGIIVWKLAAGMQLYWLASSSVGILQSGLLRYQWNKRQQSKK